MDEIAKDRRASVKEVVIGAIALGVGICLLATAVLTPFALFKYIAW